MNRDDGRSACARIAGWCLTLVAILLLYVLSYAPFLRMTATHMPPGAYGSGSSRAIIGRLTIYQTRHWFFAPARSITASSPLREPLLLWADLWGMRQIVASQKP